VNSSRAFSSRLMSDLTNSISPGKSMAVLSGHSTVECAIPYSRFGDRKGHLKDEFRGVTGSNQYPRKSHPTRGGGNTI
jgi:hypothetical protein